MNEEDRGSGGWSWLTWLVLGTGLLLTIATFLPYFVRARVTTSLNACINNLRQIDGAKQQFALEHKLSPGAPVAWTNLVGADSYLRQMPICEAGGTYTINPIGTKPTCNAADPSHVLPP